MVKRTREVLLVALVLGFCVSYTAFAQAEKPIPNYQTVYESMVAMKNALESVTSKEAYNLIQSHRRGCPCRRKNFVIIDVRTPEEYVNGHIENAINLDYYSITFEDGLK